MDDVSKYTVLKSLESKNIDIVKNSTALIESVNKHIKLGWQPLGPPSHVDIGQAFILFYQAMIKK